MNALATMTRSRALAIALAVGAVAAVFAAFWAVLPGPLLQREGRIAALRAEIIALEKQRARLGDPARWAAARERALASRSQFLSKETNTPPFAQVQMTLRAAAQNAGLAVISAQEFSAVGESEGAAGARMNLSGDFNAVSEFLSALAVAEPRLIVNEFSIRPHGGAGAGDFSVTIAATALYWSEAGA